MNYTLRIIIADTWKSIGHSKDNSKNDSHRIKGKILKEVGKHIFEKKVGKNPDIDIDKKTKKIKLKGVGPYKGQIHETEIDAEDYFILFFFSSENYHDDTLNTDTSELEFDSHYKIPLNLEVLSILLDYIFEKENERYIFIEFTN